ncbi:MAG: preprotein translocase subunit YajC [Firmicutes bacterium]|nr:preprotein translocase subunit YajC [Bacillota bacterium]
MFQNLLAEENGNGGGNEWIMFVILGAMVGLFIVMMFLNRRRQRRIMDEQVGMLDRLRMGMRIKTVSGVIGRIKEIREEVGGMRTILIETGNDKFSSFMQIDINAVMEIVGEAGHQAEAAPVIDHQPETFESMKERAREGREEDFNAAEFVEKSNSTRKKSSKK